MKVGSLSLASQPVWKISSRHSEMAECMLHYLGGRGRELCNFKIINSRIVRLMRLRFGAGGGGETYPFLHCSGHRIPSSWYLTTICNSSYRFKRIQHLLQTYKGTRQHHLQQGWLLKLLLLTYCCKKLSPQAALVKHAFNSSPQDAQAGESEFKARAT